MNQREEFPDLSADEERLLDMLVEYDQALADGTLAPSETHVPLRTGTEYADQLARGKHLLELMATIGNQRDQDDIEIGAAQSMAEAKLSAGNLDEILTPGRGNFPTIQHLGRFVIERELGIGGHGVVLLAFDPVLKRQVALKVPRSEDMMSAELRRRFLNEARAAARLTHPNLVSVYEVGEAGRVGYIASAYCTGPSLATWLKEKIGLLAPRPAARLIKQLAEAMHYAHSQGVLHRDIKPSNVLLEPKAAGGEFGAVSDDAFPFVPKLVDFGLAKLSGNGGAETRSGVAMGTPGYMAPEQVAGRVDEIGPATDVYGLGAVLYELLTGQRPFIGTCEADCLHRILSEEPTAPSRFSGASGPDIEAICLKCLEKNPARRYVSAQALADDLRRYLVGEPIQARRVNRFERLARWARRNPGIATLTTAVLLLLTALAVGSTVAAIRIERARDREQDALATARFETERAEDFAAKAQQESATAQRVAHFLEAMFRSADPVGVEGVRFQARVGRASELTAVEILRQGGDTVSADLNGQPAVQSKLMAVIGSVYVTLGMLREATPLLERSLQIREELYGDDSLEIAESLHDLASLRFTNFDFSATKQLLHRALAIRTERLGPQDPETIRTKFNLAWLIITNGHETEAEKALALPLMEEVLQYHRRESDSPTRYAFALLGLAMLRYEVEKKPFEAAMLVADANRVLSDQSDSQIASGLTAMLRSYAQRRVGNHRAALTSVESAIAQMREAVGDQHPALVWPRFMWAEALIGAGEHAQAVQVYRETAELCEQVYGDANHRAIGITKARMAEPLRLMDDFDQAEAVLRESLAIFRREDTNLSNREHCLRSLLGILERQDRQAAAVELCQEELRGARALPESAERTTYLRTVLCQTAQAEEALGHWDIAQAALEEAIGIQQSLAAAGDLPLADMMMNLARLALAHGATDKYQQVCHKMMTTGWSKPTRERMRELVWTCALAPNPLTNPQQLVGLAEDARGRNRTAASYQRPLAAALYRAGRFEEAIELLRQAPQLLQDGDVWADHALLSMAYAQAGRTTEAADQLDKASQASSVAAPSEQTPASVRRAKIERAALLEEASQLLQSRPAPHESPAT
jgi:tetratricopeptide (TPR) repeat protein/tRNA A-37 threonylcarbamoyl transferase component Bud32